MTARIRLTAHALLALARRGISEELAIRAAEHPDRIVADGDRQIHQALVPFPPDGRLYLVRVVVEVSEAEIVVVTAYRTSRIEKYGAAP